MTTSQTFPTTYTPPGATGAGSGPLGFTLPPELEASAPPEASGHARDDVRLMVSSRADDRVIHTRFPAIGDYLHRGDLLVINSSGTLNAALPAARANGAPLELHLSTRLPGGLWSVELRLPGEHGTLPFREAVPGETLSLPAGASATLHAPYRAPGEAVGASRGRPATPLAAPAPAKGGVRLWLASLDLPGPLLPYLDRHGFPIRYGYVPERWPASAYQTVFATEPGSAEMPSAGRAFTPELVTGLVARGVQFAPLLLNCGVASLEDHEPPYEEEYRVPSETARLVNAAHAEGRRAIAVGTTAVRALESVADERGLAHPGRGWTDLVVTPERGPRVVDGLLTGMHEPRASHLAMLEAFAGRSHIERAYAEALRERYLWHEFGDLHLILP